MTITHGKPGKCITTSTHNNTGVRGYYLVLSNRARHWIGESVYDAARDLEKVCTKYLSDEIGWDYWIDYCHGYDVKGNLAWANADQSDIILHRAENI
jgi:hypothetical protein